MPIWQGKVPLLNPWDPPCSWPTLAWEFRRRHGLTLFDGVLSNINVADNIVKGESFFFNEVQRIKNTIDKINNGKKWLVLIDELFKGTNVQDAMKCRAQ